MLQRRGGAGAGAERTKSIVRRMRRDTAPNAAKVTPVRALSPSRSFSRSGVDRDNAASRDIRKFARSDGWEGDQRVRLRR